MPIDARIPLLAAQGAQIDLPALYQQSQESQVRQMAIKQAQQKQQQDDQQAALQQQVGGLAASGDLTGADNAALSAGNFDLHAHVAGLQDEHRKALAQKSATGAAVAFQAKSLPYEQRKAAIEAASPQLVAAGWKPEDIAAFDPTDANIDGLVASTQSIDQALSRYDKAHEGFTLGQDQQRYDGAGNLIASGPESIKAVTTPADSTTTIFGGAGHTGIGAPAGQRYTGGWTPRARNGGDNPDNVVDSKISGVAQFLGVAPGADISHLNPMKIATAMTLSEGGDGSLADRNNNPANLRDTSGNFRTFPNKQAGLAAAAALVRRKIASGQTTVQTLIEGVPAHNGPVVIKGPANADATPLDSNAIDYVAQQYAATGQMPPLGMGKQAAAMRAQIIGRAAVLAKQQGITGTEAVGVHADTKANTAALVTLQRNANQVIAFERTANYNADQVLQTMYQGSAGGIPAFNGWVQAGRKATGDPAVTRFNTAIQGYANEYAKVISGATGGAVTSDSARHEVMSTINNAMTPLQLSGVIDQGRKEMANRKRGLDEQADALRSVLRGKKATESPITTSQAQGHPANRPSLQSIFGR